METFEALGNYLREGRSGTLATIISRIGAAPRDAGAKVFIGDDGRVYGSVGGGCVEAEVWQHARSVLREEKTKALRYTLSGATVEDEGMICGGTVELFLEPVTAKHAGVYRAVLDCLSGGGTAILLTSTGDAPFRKAIALEDGTVLGDLAVPGNLNDLKERVRHPSLRIEDGVLIETLVPPPRVYIYGGGHISQHISKMAKAVDFLVTVIDDRENFANSERFPEADETIVEEFCDVFRKTRPPDNGYAVIVTRGHKHDAVVLEEVLKRPPRYTGMIGSRRKVKILLDDLRAKGYREELLRSVHAPIGLDIGAETPQEIAISIVAELIKTRSAA